LGTGAHSAEQALSIGGMSVHLSSERAEALLSPVEVARIANVSLSTVRREIERGELRARHVGRQLRILPEDFDAYLDREQR
jgi:excisionase family DNA binding protein